MKRANEFDLMRIILTILVVIGHSNHIDISFGNGGINYLLPSTVNPIYNSILLPLNNVVSYIYVYHMPSFFLISGIVLYKTQKKALTSFPNLFYNKFIRLVIPYVLYGLLWMLPLKYFSNVYDKESINKAIAGFLSGSSDTGYLWFLLTLFWCFIFFYPVYKLFKDNNIIIFFLGLIISQTGIAITNLLDFKFLCINTSFEYFGYFCTGYVIAKYLTNNLKSEVYIFSLIFFCILSICTISPLVQNYPNLFILIEVATNFIVIYSFCILITRYTNFINTKIYKMLNKRSMDIYLLHDPMMYVILYFAFMYSWIFSYTSGVILYFGCRIFGVIIASILIATFRDKLKVIIPKIFNKVYQVLKTQE
jgi:fucose 4-O-acetylase-like acetyltransferase